MSLQTPTTRDLSDQIIGQLEGQLGQTVPYLPRAFARVLAWVLAGVTVLLYKYAGFIFLQLFVAHATYDQTTINGKVVRPLLEWGRLLGVGDPQAAVRAEHVISVPVTNQTGSLKAGHVFYYAATRVLYRVVADVALDAPTVQARIRAFSDESGGDGSGAIGNLAAGAIVSFATPPANVGTDCTIVSTPVPGVDAESVEHYRGRIVKRVQRRPQGGAYADYQSWAEEVEGIANVYVYTADEPGEVDVYVEATPESSGDPDGIPTNDQLTAVYDAIELNEAGKATRRPVGAGVNTLPISRQEFDVEITGLDPNTPENQAAIESAIAEHLFSREPYIVGLSTLPRNDRVTQAAISGVVDTVADARGASVTSVEITPGPAITLGHGQKAKLGDATFV